MFSRLRTQFGTAGLVVAIVALVAALGGGAIAANSGSDGSATASAQKGKQGPRGKRGPKGPKGDAGPAGPVGPAGPAGPAGAKGSAGAPGAPGASGAKGATGATGPNGTPGTPGTPGATGATGATGDAGAAGATGATGPEGVCSTSACALPKGVTLRGTWSVGQENALAAAEPLLMSISFSIPLSTNTFQVHYVKESETENPGATKICKGGAASPTVDNTVSGATVLCIFASKETNWTLPRDDIFGGTVKSANVKTPAIARSGGGVFEGVTAAAGAAIAYGTWAVRTAP